MISFIYREMYGFVIFEDKAICVLEESVLDYLSVKWMFVNI